MVGRAKPTCFILFIQATYWQQRDAKTPIDSSEGVLMDNGPQLRLYQGDFCPRYWMHDIHLKLYCTEYCNRMFLQLITKRTASRKTGRISFQTDHFFFLQGQTQTDQFGGEGFLDSLQKTFQDLSSMHTKFSKIKNQMSRMLLTTIVFSCRQFMSNITLFT